MRRPQQHITDAKGDAQLRAVFAPTGWTLNRTENDYGIDYEIEIFHDSQSTGASFRAQLKSSESTRYSADGSFVSQTIDARNARYLCQEVSAPVIIFHADVQNGRTYWAAPQLDIAALETFVGAPERDSLTLRIPTANLLPGTLDLLLEAVRSAKVILASRVLVTVNIPEFVGSIRNRIDEEEVIRELKLKANALQVLQVEKLFKAGSAGEARGRIRELLADPASSVGTKFWSLLMAEKVELQALKEGGRRADRTEIQLSITGELQHITRQGPSHLKFYALIARKAAELEGLVLADFGLYMNWKVNEAQGDPFWKIQLTFRRAELVREIVLKYNQCVRLARYAAGYKHQWVLPTALLRIAMAISVFALRLKFEGLEEARGRFAQSSLAICRLAAKIAASYQDGEAFVDATVAAFLVDPNEGSEARNFAARALAAIRDPALKGDAEKRMQACTESLRATETEIAHRRMSLDEARQTYENMIRALGIDLSDPNDRIAQVVRIGLKDLDPSRVLRNCEHIFITLSFQGLPAQWLQMPTAGGKVLHCDLHRYAVEGLDLDFAYQVFKREYCDQCPDCLPRPPEWVYSLDWQDEENKRHEQFVRDFQQRAGRRGHSG